MDVRLVPHQNNPTNSKTPRFSGGFYFAGVPGLEPRTNEPESLVLPITPYPKGQNRGLDRLSSLTHDAVPKQTEPTNAEIGALI